MVVDRDLMDPLNTLEWYGVKGMDFYPSNVTITRLPMVRFFGHGVPPIGHVDRSLGRSVSTGEWEEGRTGGPRL